MIKFSYVITLLIYIICSSANGQNTVYQYNNYNHTITFLNHKINFQLKPYKNSPKISEVKRQYHWYANNEIQVTENGYSGKLLNGLYTDFYENRNLREQGQFKTGLKHGEWKKWSLRGKILETINFSDGLRHGAYAKYNELGQLMETTSYKNDKIDGKLHHHIKPDSIVTTQYKNGNVELKTQSWLKRKILMKKPAKTLKAG
ncbi:MAG: hypothetical protein EOO43_05105 [Flavobacterium sp.]|nr:MAG: hypothetical protein EOO43_05105 [Flavobacterium sp.]